MATAKLYKFNKRRNSTKQISNETATTINVQLKSGTSLISPTFILENSGVFDYNYIDYENRFYYVTDVVSVNNNLWEVSCIEDYLGTWKTDIGRTSAIILYATGGANRIIDSRLGVTTNPQISHAQAGINGFTITDSNQGTIIISVTGVGSFGNYLMQDSTQVDQLLDAYQNYFDTITTWTDAAEAIKTACNQFLYGGSAGNCLKNAISVPIFPGSSGWLGQAEEIVLGKYPTGLYGYKVEVPTISGSCSVSIPWRTINWRRTSPYTKVYLYLPLIGTLTIPSGEIMDSESLNVLYGVNMCSGEVSAQVKAGNRIIATGSASCGMAVTYGSSNVSGGKIASAISVGVGAVGAVAAGVVSGGAATLALGGGLASSAAGLLSALGGESGGAGGLGGGATNVLDKVVHCWCITRDTTETSSNMDSILGKPVMAKHKISEYSGYVQTDAICISGNMLDSEKRAIEEMCNRGIYYE